MILVITLAGLALCWLHYLFGYYLGADRGSRIGLAEAAKARAELEQARVPTETLRELVPDLVARNERQEATIAELQKEAEEYGRLIADQCTQGDALVNANLDLNLQVRHLTEQIEALRNQ